MEPQTGQPQYADPHSRRRGGGRSRGRSPVRREIGSRPQMVMGTAESYFDQGNALRESGQLEQAVEAYFHALELAPESAEVLNNLGDALRAQGKPAEAIAACSKAIELRPDYAEAHNNLGNALRDSNRFEEAIESYTRALRLLPNVPSIHNNLGIVLSIQGRLDEAMVAYATAIRLKPDYAKAHNNLGSALRDKRRPEEAIRACRRAIELKPDFAQAYYNLGCALSELRRFDEAIVVYERAIELHPNHAGAFNHLADAFRERGRLADAAAAYRKSLQIKPANARALCSYGHVLKDAGQVDEAIVAYEKAIQLQPDLVEAHYNLGNALRDKRRYDEAIAAYTCAVSLRPEAATTHLHLGVVLNMRGRLDEAIAAYSEAVRLKPDYAKAHNNLGAALRDAGRLDEAVAACQTAVTLNPKYGMAHYNLGNVFKDLRRHDEAIASYTIATELHPDMAEAHNNLGNVLWEAGELDAAIAAYRRAVELKPQLAEARANLESALADKHLLEQSRMEESESAPEAEAATEPQAEEISDQAPAPVAEAESVATIEPHEADAPPVVVDLSADDEPHAEADPSDTAELAAQAAFVGFAAEIPDLIVRPAEPAAAASVPAAVHADGGDDDLALTPFLEAELPEADEASEEQPRTDAAVPELVQTPADAPALEVPISDAAPEGVEPQPVEISPESAPVESATDASSSSSEEPAVAPPSNFTSSADFLAEPAETTLPEAIPPVVVSEELAPPADLQSAEVVTSASEGESNVEVVAEEPLPLSPLEKTDDTTAFTPEAIDAPPAATATALLEDAITLDAHTPEPVGGITVFEAVISEAGELQELAASDVNVPVESLAVASDVAVSEQPEPSAEELPAVQSDENEPSADIVCGAPPESEPQLAHDIDESSVVTDPVEAPAIEERVIEPVAALSDALEVELTAPPVEATSSVDLAEGEVPYSSVEPVGDPTADQSMAPSAEIDPYPLAADVDAAESHEPLLEPIAADEPPTEVLDDGVSLPPLSELEEVPAEDPVPLGLADLIGADAFASLSQDTPGLTSTSHSHFQEVADPDVAFEPAVESFSEPVAVTPPDPDPEPRELEVAAEPEPVSEPGVPVLVGEVMDLVPRRETTANVFAADPALPAEGRPASGNRGPAWPFSDEGIGASRVALLTHAATLRDASTLHFSEPEASHLVPQPTMSLPELPEEVMDSPEPPPAPMETVVVAEFGVPAFGPSADVPAETEASPADDPAPETELAPPVAWEEHAWGLTAPLDIQPPETLDADEPPEPVLAPLDVAGASHYFEASLASVLQIDLPEAATTAPQETREASDAAPPDAGPAKATGDDADRSSPPEPIPQPAVAAAPAEPDAAETLYRLGKNLRDQQQWDDAIVVFRQAVALRSHFPEAQSAYANALQSKGRLEEAIAAYRTAIAMAPDWAEVHNELAAALGSSGRLDEAVALCRKAIELKPDFAQAHYNLAAALQGRGELAESVAVYRRLAAGRPDDAEVQFRLGKALQRSDKTEEACAAFQEAVKLRPDFPEGLFELGMVLKRLGRDKEALKAFRQALTLRSDFVQAQNALLDMAFPQ